MTNTGFVALPILAAIYGQPAVLPAAVATVFVAAVMFPIGRAVGIGRAQHVLRSFELLGHLHQCQRLARPCVEAAVNADRKVTPIGVFGTPSSH